MSNKNIKSLQKKLSPEYEEANSKRKKIAKLFNQKGFEHYQLDQFQEALKCQQRAIDVKHKIPLITLYKCPFLYITYKNKVGARELGVSL